MVQLKNLSVTQAETPPEPNPGQTQVLGGYLTVKPTDIAPKFRFIIVSHNLSFTTGLTATAWRYDEVWMEIPSSRVGRESGKLIVHPSSPESRHHYSIEISYTSTSTSASQDANTNHSPTTPLKDEAESLEAPSTTITARESDSQGVSGDAGGFGVAIAILAMLGTIVLALSKGR